MPKTILDKAKHYSLLGLGFIGISVTYIFSVIWIFQSFENFFDLFSAKSEVFIFNRDQFIGFGSFICITAGLINGITNKIDPSKITPQHNKVISIMLIIGALLLTLPFVIEPFYDYKLNNEGYYVCEPATERWLYLKTLYYTNSEQACIDLISDTN